MPGGAAAIREPWRMAAAWLDATYGPRRAGGPRGAAPPRGPLGATCASWPGPGCRRPLTSVGRTAVRRRRRALCGVRDVDPLRGAGRHRARAAGRPRRDGWLPARRVERGSALQLAGRRADPGGGGRPGAGHPGRVGGRPVPPGPGRPASWRACRAVRAERGLTTVACSGGVFQNALLLGLVVDGLEADGFRVLLHSRVPPNDGGISLGQAAFAGARDRRRSRPTDRTSRLARSGLADGGRHEVGQRVPRWS